MTDEVLPWAIVVMQDGVITEVLSDIPLQIAILDYDVDDVELEDRIPIPQLTGPVAAVDAHAVTTNANLNPKRTHQILRALSKLRLQ